MDISRKHIRHIALAGIILLVLALIVGPTVKAAAPESLIKTTGNSAVYYLGNDGKRYVFPNENVFYSWYPNFAGVAIVSSSELASYPLGGNIYLRPGTRLAKIVSSPAVYAVLPGGVLSKIENEAQARSIYGEHWQGRIVDVPDSLFANYKIGASLTAGQIPAGSLVKQINTNDYYYFDGANFRLINDENALKANRLEFTNAITATINSTLGAVIYGQDKPLLVQIQGSNNVVSGGSTNPPAPGSGGTSNLSLNTSEHLAHAQNFAIPSDAVDGDTVGEMTTFWKQHDNRSLTYSIINGGGFSVDNNGIIKLTDSDVLSGRNSITIRVKAEDKTANLYEEADMTIKILPATSTVYIDPSAAINGNGTRSNPYKTWAGVTIGANKNYLQKRGTEISLAARINIGSNNNVLIGAYGTGAEPKVKIYNLVGGTNAAVSMTGSNNIVRDLDIDAKQSITGVYSGGGDDNQVDNVRIQNSEWGLRTMTAATGFKLLNSEIAYTGDDGHYSQNHDNMEIAHNYIHHVNQHWNENSYWYKGKTEALAPGDGIQLNGTILNFNIHHNIIDRSDTDNKFCVIISPIQNNAVSNGLLEYNNCTLRADSNESGFYIFHGVFGAKIRYNTFVNETGIYSHSKDLIISNNTFINSRLFAQYGGDKLVFDNTFLNN